MPPDRVITERQYQRLRVLGSGSAGLSWGKRDTEVFLRRGWVTAEWRAPYYQMVRITATGLRALADGVERYGLPGLGPSPMTERRVCADCGSRSYLWESIPVERHIEEAAA